MVLQAKFFPYKYWIISTCIHVHYVTLVLAIDTEEDGVSIVLACASTLFINHENLLLVFTITTFFTLPAGNQLSFYYIYSVRWTIQFNFENQKTWNLINLYFTLKIVFRVFDDILMFLKSFAFWFLDRIFNMLHLYFCHLALLIITCVLTCLSSACHLPNFSSVVRKLSSHFHIHTIHSFGYF